MDFLRSKEIRLFLVLSCFFVTNVLVAEIIGAKIFSLEAFLGLAPAQIQLWGATLDFNLTAGVLIWPLVFIFTDVINEYFGKRGVRYISTLSAGLMVYVFIVFWITTKLPPAQFWMDLYIEELNINQAFNYIFLQGLGIIIGSISAFLIGQIVDVFSFQYIRKLTSGKRLWLRATGSTLVSQLIDSFVVLFIAFFIFGRMSLSMVLAIAVVNYIYKFIVAVLLTPSLYLIHTIIDTYLGKELSEKMRSKAAQSSFL